MSSGLKNRHKLKNKNALSERVRVRDGVEPETVQHRRSEVLQTTLDRFDQDVGDVEGLDLGLKVVRQPACSNNQAANSAQTSSSSLLQQSRRKHACAATWPEGHRS